MNKKKPRNLYDEDLNVHDLINKLWREKFTILSVIFIFVIIGYFNSNKFIKPVENLYKTQIVIKLHPQNYFIKYKNILDLDIAEIYYQEFQYSLLSLDNLIMFSNEYGYTKKFLSLENKKKIREYFEEKFQKIENEKFNLKLESQTVQKTFLATYSFLFKENFPGEEFLNNYILHTNKIILGKIKTIVLESLEFEIELLKKNIKISQALNIEEPSFPIISMLDFYNAINSKTALSQNKNSYSYFSGKKLLTQELVSLKDTIKKIESEEFKYNPIIESATKPQQNLPTKNFSIIQLLGSMFFLGLFLSLLLIYIKSSLLKKKK